MSRLRNISPTDLAVFYPPGNPNSMSVKAGEYLEVKGEVTEIEDAYQVGEGDDTRLYAKALWQLEKSKSSKSSSDTKTETKPTGNGNGNTDAEVR